MTEYITKREVAGFLNDLLEEDDGTLGAILARKVDAFARGGLLENEALHMELIHTALPEVRRWSARGRLTSAGGYREMYYRANAQSDSASIYALASNPELPVSHQLKLIVEHSEITNVIAIASVTRDADIIDSLSKHEYVDVRCAIAENKATHASALARLSTDDEPSVRKRVAGNTAATVDTLLNLRSDAHPDVRDCALIFGLLRHPEHFASDV
jgi:hypothetical protein